MTFAVFHNFTGLERVLQNSMTLQDPWAPCCKETSASRKVFFHKKWKNKLAPYGTGGRLLLTANFKVT